MTTKIIVNYTGRKGGGSVYAYEMTKGLLENGCQVYAILSKDIENREKWESLGLKETIFISTYNSISTYIINTVYFKLFYKYKIKKQIKQIEFDAIYIPMIQPWTSTINSICKSRKKIITLHDPKPHSGSNKFFNYICKKTVKEADEVIILTDKFKEYTANYYKKEKKHIYVIPHGVFDYYNKIEKKEKDFTYDSKKYNFLFFGRITKYKGLEILAKAYLKLSQEYNNITLTIVGSGDFSPYKKIYSGLNNTKIINKWINDEEVGSFFEGDNIITVLPYIDATQSGVVPIAMEFRSLVIASNTGGLSEQIVDNKTGYLFESGDSESLYKKMKYVVENYADLDAIKNNASEYIRSLSWISLSNKLKIIAETKEE
jgi:glycosyltransferase involved in cell wall biosynthesis